MLSNCPSLISAFRGSFSGSASGRYFSLNTFCSSPSGIFSRLSRSMIPHAMLVYALPTDAIAGMPRDCPCRNIARRPANRAGPPAAHRAGCFAAHTRMPDRACRDPCPRPCGLRRAGQRPPSSGDVGRREVLVRSEDGERKDEEQRGEKDASASAAKRPSVTASVFRLFVHLLIFARQECEAAAPPASRSRVRYRSLGSSPSAPDPRSDTGVSRFSDGRKCARPSSPTLIVPGGDSLKYASFGRTAYSTAAISGAGASYGIGR